MSAPCQTCTLSAINYDYWVSIAFVVVCVTLVGVCVVLLRFAKTNLESYNYRTSFVETIDNEIFGLLLIYLLPLITKDLETYNWAIWILVTLLFCFIVAVSYGFHFNPLLIFLGYHFYKVTESGGVTYVLITNRRIYKTDETLNVSSLTEYVLIEKKPPD